MIDIRRGMGRVGYVLLVLWGIPLVRIFYLSIFFAPPRNVFDQFDPGALSPVQAYLALFGYMIGPPILVFLLWRAVLWIGRGFINSN